MTTERTLKWLDLFGKIQHIHEQARWERDTIVLTTDPPTWQDLEAVVDYVTYIENQMVELDRKVNRRTNWSELIG